MEFYKTNEENVFATISENQTFYFTEYAVVLITQVTDVIQKEGGLLDGKEAEETGEIWNKVKDFHLLEQKEGMSFFINRTTYEIFAMISGTMIPIDQASSKVKILSEKKKLKDFLKGIKKTKESYQLGDRVLIYGPTGTGKTYNLIEFLKTAKIPNVIIPVTEGMEDIDFFNRVVPGATGVEYRQKGICEFLEKAEKGQKICIVLDELNRGTNSLMNLILKCLDPVDGKNYYLNDVIQDKTYVIPQENLLWAATVNLGGKYTGTNSLDEALLDRFNIVKYKGYDLDVEKTIIQSAISDKANVKKVQTLVEEVRSYHKAGEIRAPISTRSVKMWMEDYINTGDIIQSFQKTVLYRVVSVDDYGNPNSEEIQILQKKFKEIIS